MYMMTCTGEIHGNFKMLVTSGEEKRQKSGDLGELVPFYFLLLKIDLIHIWQNVNICLILVVCTQVSILVGAFTYLKLYRIIIF